MLFQIYLIKPLFPAISHVEKTHNCSCWRKRKLHFFGTGNVFLLKGKVLFGPGKVFGSGKVLFWTGKVLFWTGRVLFWIGKVLFGSGKVFGTGKVLFGTGEVIFGTGKVRWSLLVLLKGNREWWKIIVFVAFNCWRKIKNQLSIVYL